MTREERKLVAAVEISQKLEKDRQRKQDQASKGKEAAGELRAADHAARVNNSSTRKRLPAPARKEQMQGVRGRGHLPVPARTEPM